MVFIVKDSCNYCFEAGSLEADIFKELYHGDTWVKLNPYQYKTIRKYIDEGLINERGSALFLLSNSEDTEGARDIKLGLSPRARIYLL